MTCSECKKRFGKKMRCGFCKNNPRNDDGAAYRKQFDHEVRMLLNSIPKDDAKLIRESLNSIGQNLTPAERKTEKPFEF